MQSQSPKSLLERWRDFPGAAGCWWEAAWCSPGPRVVSRYHLAFLKVWASVPSQAFHPEKISRRLWSPTGWLPQLGIWDFLCFGRRAQERVLGWWSMRESKCTFKSEGQAIVLKRQFKDVENFDWGQNYSGLIMTCSALLEKFWSGQGAAGTRHTH